MHLELVRDRPNVDALDSTSNSMNSISSMRVRRRFLHPVWLIVSLPGYIGWRLLPALDIGPAGIVIGIAALLAACVIIPLSVGSRSMKNRNFADRIAWIPLA